MVPQKINEVQDFINKHLEESITLKIERVKEIFDVSLTPRKSPPKGEGPLGVALVKTAIKKYPWYLAPWQGILATANLTSDIIFGYIRAIKNVIARVPSGVELIGPIGVFHLLSQASQVGINYFLQFLGMIAVYTALFNALPIPAVDGGKLLFLGIEAVRRKPISQETEEKITTFFFGIIIIVAFLVTIKDILKFF